MMMFAGRPVAVKKAFYAALIRNLKEDCGITSTDIELTITESLRHDWLIRRSPGDELTLNYNVQHQADDKA